MPPPSPLFHSPAPSLLRLLLCFHFPLLSLISDPAETLRLQFLQRCVHSFLCCFLPRSPASHIPSMPTPPYAWLLTGAYFTMAHIRQPDEGNTVRLFGFFRRVWSLTRAHCASVSVCLFSYNLRPVIPRMKRGEQTGSFCSVHLDEKNRKRFHRKSIS